MARYSPMESGGDPVRTILVRQGYVLVDKDDKIVIDEYGEAFTYANRDSAKAAIRNFKSE